MSYSLHTATKLAAKRAAIWPLTFIRTPGRASEFARYTSVSAASLALDASVFALLLKVQAMHVAVAGSIGCMAGLLLHYFLSLHYVFNATATQKSKHRLIGEYALTGVMGFIVSTIVILIAHNLLGWPAWLSKAAAVAATFIAVYFVRASFVFAPANNLPQHINRTG